MKGTGRDSDLTELVLGLKPVGPIRVPVHDLRTPVKAGIIQSSAHTVIDGWVVLQTQRLCFASESMSKTCARKCAVKKRDKGEDG
jgi:hypothetical protein